MGDRLSIDSIVQRLPDADISKRRHHRPLQILKLHTKEEFGCVSGVESGISRGTVRRPIPFPDICLPRLHCLKERTWVRDDLHQNTAVVNGRLVPIVRVRLEEIMILRDRLARVELIRASSARLARKLTGLLKKGGA